MARSKSSSGVFLVFGGRLCPFPSPRLLSRAEREQLRAECPALPPSRVALLVRSVGMPAAARSWTWTCACCAGRRRSGGGAAGDTAGASGCRAEEGDEWSLFIDLPVLEAATGGFSDDNLLGRGGFGPVYKANLTLILSSLSLFSPSTHHFCFFYTIYFLA